MTEQGGDEVLRKHATTMEELLQRMREPLKADDIRTVQGQGKREYVSGGDVVYNMFTDFGPFGWESRLQRLEHTPPRLVLVEDVDERGRPIVNKNTGEVQKVEAWNCCAVAVVRVTLRLPDGTVRERDGVGAASSLHMPHAEEAVENAVKSAETDALKRACYPLGPRYGLALRFKDRDEREALGLIERNEAREKARQAMRERAARAQPNNKSAATPPGGAPAGAASTHAAPAASSAQDEDLRREATRLLFEVADAGVKARVTKALAEAKDVARLQAILDGVREALRRQSAAKAEREDPTALQGQVNPAATSPATTSAAGQAAGPVAGAPASPDTSNTGASAATQPRPLSDAAPAAPSATPAGSSATPASSGDELAVDLTGHDQRTAVTPTLDPGPVHDQASVPGHGTVYGEKAAEVDGERMPDTPQSLAWKLVVHIPDPYIGTQLAGGVTPSNCPQFGVIVPADPTVDDLRRAGWEAPGAGPDVLAKIRDVDPVAQAVLGAVTKRALELAGGKREVLGWLWTQLGMPKKDEGLPNAYQVRLLAWACAMQARRAEARALEQAVRE